MEKEYKIVKDFEGIFDEKQKINLYIFDLEENSHILGFSGEAGIFYHLINKNAKFGRFYGEFEVLDMFQSSADEETLIIVCKNTQNELKEKLDSVKPIVKAKKELKEKIKEDILDIQTDYVEDIEFIKQALSGEGLTEEDNRIIGVYNGFIEELDELKKKVENM